MGVAMVCMICTQSCKEGPGDITPWMDKKQIKHVSLQVLLTIEQQAHLDVTSTKVTQPNTLKSCMH